MLPSNKRDDTTETHGYIPLDSVFLSSYLRLYFHMDVMAIIIRQTAE